MLPSDASSSRHARRTTLLGRFEENILFAAIACGRNATAKAISDRIKSRIGERSVSYVHTTLERLSDKGLMEKTTDCGVLDQTGRRKACSYSVTEDGLFNAAYSYGMVTELAREAGILEDGADLRLSA